ncbi:hypothetical protein VIGAN_10243900, partial [Vigna angularis var. angularis]
AKSTTTLGWFPLLTGNLVGREHSSPLKKTLEGNPSPFAIWIFGEYFLVKEITDCCFPGTCGFDLLSKAIR